MPRGESTRATWDSGKRQRVSVGSTRIRNGVEQIRVKSEKGWFYWINNTFDSLRKHKKECNTPNENDLIIIERVKGDWSKLTSKQRDRLRKKGIDIPSYAGKHLIGKPKSIQHRQRIGESHRKHPLNKVAKDRASKARIRASFEYREWRQQVFERDNYTCQKCEARNGNGKEVFLEAHHLKSYTHYPELRFEVSNGQTLCKLCHRKENAKQMMGNGNGQRKTSLAG